MKVISVRENPEYKDIMIRYFQKTWASPNSMMVYADCISSSITASNPLPQWYILMEEDQIIGCAGLITNDFISRMDLYPWLCALYIEEEYRGKNLGKLLMDKAKADTRAAGFQNLYLCTDHENYYEKFGFEFIGTGYHPWGESSRIYSTVL
jgi:GNAT superfamily N-acetyltransferase